VSEADFRRATEVTYLGAVWGTMASLKRMRARNRGVIVQVGSALAYRSIPLQAPYCAAKAALRGLTDSLRSELIHDNSAVRLTMVHLSACNTPQFDWGRTTMPCMPKPVGPVFQPELAADAIVRAAMGDDRREWWVGWPAVQAILAQRVVPGLLDRFLALKAYDGQQSDEPLPADRLDNLHRPAPGHAASHGRFDAAARERSVQWWLSTHRTLATPAAIAVLVTVSVWLAL
jgi:NAD(P)-dependent dehydrogenase (short-subunit alcohol dehydrogenase family)